MVYNLISFIGMSPSGKASGFGPDIRGFESLHPNQKLILLPYYVTFKEKRWQMT